MLHLTELETTYSFRRIKAALGRICSEEPIIGFLYPISNLQISDAIQNPSSYDGHINLKKCGQGRSLVRNYPAGVCVSRESQCAGVHTAYERKRDCVEVEEACVVQQLRAFCHRVEEWDKCGKVD